MEGDRQIRYYRHQKEMLILLYTVYMYVCMYSMCLNYSYLRMYVDISMHMKVCMYVCMYVCVCMYE